MSALRRTASNENRTPPSLRVDFDGRPDAQPADDRPGSLEQALDR